METLPALAKSIGRHEEVSGGERPKHAVMTDSSQHHGCDAAALRAIGIATKLAWCDRRAKIGGNGFGGPGEDAGFRAAGGRLHFANERLGHIEGGEFLAQ